MSKKITGNDEKRMGERANVPMGFQCEAEKIITQRCKEVKICRVGIPDLQVIPGLLTVG